jgi:NAD(P)-dependent dehydrogenase (short-subunit alcohol dehydrogenase family)
MSDYALVTGGSRNIGRTIAERLKADGYRVLMLDILEPEDPSLGEFMRVDLSDITATAQALAWAVDGRAVTRLVNNAGIVGAKSLEDTRPEDVDAVLALNIRAAVQCAQAVLPGMREQGFGRIVNIASRAALGKELRTAYAASKAGLIGMTKTWALELGGHGVTVNAIGPGPIETSLFRDANPPDDPRTKAIRDSIPVGRMGQPEDIAHAVSFFFDERSSFVTGQVLYVCGGMTVGRAPI